MDISRQVHCLTNKKQNSIMHLISAFIVFAQLLSAMRLLMQIRSLFLVLFIISVRLCHTEETYDQQTASRKSFISSLIPKPIKVVGSHLFSPTNWTSHVNSDTHDLQITENVLSEYGSPSGSKDDLPIKENSSIWESVFGFLKKGRPIFDQMNFITTGYDTLLQMGSCMTTKDFYDPDLGQIILNKTRDCNIRCGEYCSLFKITK